MSDVSRIYIRAQLESMLGHPLLQLNALDSSGDPSSFRLAEGPPPVYERPLPGRAYWLIWRCEEGDTTGACWAVGEPLRQDEWKFITKCSKHAQEEDLYSRTRWLDAFWKSLNDLINIVRRANGTADFLSHRIIIETPDHSDRENICLAQFIVASEERGQANFGFQITNVTPQYAAKLLSGYLLGVPDEDLPLFAEAELRG